MQGDSFLQAMIMHMVEDQVRELRLARMDMPMDFSTFPFSIVRFDKVVKVLELASSGTVSEHPTRLAIEDDQGRRFWVEFFYSDDGKHLVFRLLDR